MNSSLHNWTSHCQVLEQVQLPQQCSLSKVCFMSFDLIFLWFSNLRLFDSHPKYTNLLHMVKASLHHLEVIGWQHKRRALSRGTHLCYWFSIVCNKCCTVISLPPPLLSEAFRLHCECLIEAMSHSIEILHIKLYVWTACANVWFSVLYNHECPS